MKELVMKPVRRLTAALAGLTGALLAFAAVAPAALAQPFPPRPPGWDRHPPPPQPAGIYAVVVGGMPGWQIALIAVGAAPLAASVAVLVDRGWAAHRKTVTAAAYQPGQQVVPGRHLPASPWWWPMPGRPVIPRR
jgi:hypothetical protein